MTDRLFTVQALLEGLPGGAADQRPDYLLAYSGGLDSSVLLHALASASQSTSATAFNLQVVHVNHRLQASADDWQRHCEQVCQRLGLRCITEVIDRRPQAGESIEAWAREVRYQALAKHCNENTCLLTAHHQDDQAETLMLNLLRGSGPHGLAAISTDRPLNQADATIRICRPLLGFTHQSLREYAEREGLSWIDDPSNQDDSYARNYLRLQVLPILGQRWPSYADSLGRAAMIQSEVAGLLDEIAAQDLAAVLDPSGLACSIRELQKLTRRRQENLLRYWFRSQGHYPPGVRQMEILLTQVITARADAQPQLRVGSVLLRRYRDELIMQQLVVVAAGQSRRWELPGDLQLEQGLLRAECLPGQGISTARVGGAGVEVRFRQGGERCRPAGRQGSHPLRKLFQELAIPVWMRDQVPLIYIDGEIAALADYFVCEGFQAGPTENGWEIKWMR
jgi:tRNA(Ile)-lysidine synthase